MKSVNINLKRVIIGLLILSLCVTSIAFIRLSKADNSKDTNVSSTKRDTSISINSNGELQIKRTNMSTEQTMGADDTWTILVYMDGNDLEMVYGSATQDLKEMMSAHITQDLVKNVNIIVQTGGCSWWHLSDIDGTKSQRFKIDSIGMPTLLEETEQKNMGDPETLYDFLDWGIKNYPAEHMGVVFWNHGSGVSQGVCTDAYYKNDSLLVPEIEYAFSKVSKEMTSKFEIIGFDTCLSGSLEYANALAPYANYMVASANVEPGTGWNYKDVLNQLLDNPDSSGLELSKVICDSYYSAAINREPNANLTMATYDLSKVDNVCKETNKLSKYMYEKIIEDEQHYKRFSNMQSAPERVNYGMDKDNMDIGSLLYYFDISCDYQYDTNSFKNALNGFIVYSKLSDIYKNYKAVGLSLYYPAKAVNVSTLNVMRNVVFSPYYLKYQEYLAYCRLGGNRANYQTIEWEQSDYFYENTFDFLPYYKDMKTEDDVINSTLSKNQAYVNDGFINKWMSNFCTNKYRNSRNILIQKESSYSIVHVNKEFIDDIQAVYSSVFTTMGDSIVCLGEDDSATINKDTGAITSNFNGEWLMLPDGQLLTTYISNELGAKIYSIPVIINDIEMSIKIEEKILSKGKKDYILLGVWDATSHSDYEARGYLPLNKGTTITPIYNVYNPESNEYESEYGEEYTIASDFDFLFGKLDKSEYSYGVAIKGINGTTEYNKLN